MEQESSTFDYCFFASFQVLSLSTSRWFNDWRRYRGSWRTVTQVVKALTTLARTYFDSWLPFFSSCFPLFFSLSLSFLLLFLRFKNLLLRRQLERVVRRYKNEKVKILLLSIQRTIPLSPPFSTRSSRLYPLFHSSPLYFYNSPCNCFLVDPPCIHQRHHASTLELDCFELDRRLSKRLIGVIIDSVVPRKFMQKFSKRNGNDK